MKNLDDIKAKLSKLIAKEESARELGNQAEAEAFAQKIQAMLLEYELSMDEFRDKQGNVVDDVNKEKVELGDLLGSHEGTWIYRLYSACSPTNFCDCIHPFKYEYEYLTLIGTQLNREFVHYMVNQLISKLRELARRSFKDYGGTDKRNTYIRSFLAGAVKGIRERLEAEREKAKANSEQVYGLVLAKDAALKTYMESEYPPGSLGKKAQRVPQSVAGFVEGLLHGRSVGINKGVNGKGMGGTKLLN